MKLAYLVSKYPLISETFVRKEIEALEEMGQPVARFSIRQWEGAFVDPKDVAEQAKTDYILTGSKSALIRDIAQTLLLEPLRLLRTLPLLTRLYRNAGGRFAAHVAYLIEAMAFRRRAARLGINHVHVHFMSNASAVAMLAHELGGPTYSVTVHGPDELVDPPKRSMTEKVRASAFVVAITDYCRTRILEQAPDAADKVRTIRCGIDLDNYQFDAAVPQAPRIVCVGRLCHNKGQKHIPAAVAQVRKEFPDLVVDLLGGGDDEQLIREEIAHYGVEKNVVLHGWASGARVRAGIVASRALLLPSYAEGLPIVIMEALATGRPVLTTRITGIPELVDESCGWLFEPGDVNAIADALRSVMRATRKERADMGREGRRRIEERHDIRKSTRALLETFHALNPDKAPAPQPASVSAMALQAEE